MNHINNPYDTRYPALLREQDEIDEYRCVERLGSNEKATFYRHTGKNLVLPTYYAVLKTAQGDDNMTKEEVQKIAAVGGFIPYSEYCNYHRTSRLDGLQVKNFLEDKGFIVTEHGDKPRNEYARTACGLEMSSNGYIYTVQGSNKL